MSSLEKSIERTVTFYARSKRCLCLKLNVIGQIGWPDRLYIYYGFKVLFIEFKRRGELPRPMQEYIIGLLRKYGAWVEVVDDVDTGKRHIDKLTEGSCVLK